MICISLANIDYQQCQKYLSWHNCFELRLDLLEFSDDQLSHIISKKRTIIATDKLLPIADHIRIERLKSLITSGVDYIDIEYNSDEETRNDLINFAHQNQCEVILSYHNFETTPSSTDLNKIIDFCFSVGADIAKIACKANDQKDCDTLINLYHTNDNKLRKNIISIGMGIDGKLTRVAGLMLNAPFSYCAPEEGLETADGQFDFETFRQIEESTHE